MNKIKKYFQKHKLKNFEEFAVLCDVSVHLLRTVDNDPMYNMTVLTMDKIYNKTGARFGEKNALLPEMYLDHPVLRGGKIRNHKEVVKEANNYNSTN